MLDLLVETLKECEARFIPNKIVEVNGDAKYNKHLISQLGKTLKRNRIYGKDIWKLGHL